MITTFGITFSVDELVDEVACVLLITVGIVAVAIVVAAIEVVVAA